MTEVLELSELKSKLLELFETDMEHLPNSLMNVAINNNTEIYDKYLLIVNNDLDVDYLQMVYQYYYADRKDKKQDYTPSTLSDFVGRIIGESDVVIDMCAGSGALTIQRWKRNHEQKFRLYELDKNVIPFLLFNLAIRNINASVIRGDVLQDDVYEQWVVRKGEMYGNIAYIKSTI